MSFRFITKSIHAYLIDYPVAIVLIAAPFALKLGQSGPQCGFRLLSVSRRYFWLP